MQRTKGKTRSKRLQDRAARYRLQVWATDLVDLDSPIRAAWIDFKP